MRTAQLAGIGRTSGIKAIPICGYPYRNSSLVPPRCVRAETPRWLKKLRNSYLLPPFMNDQLKRGTQLGRIPVANIIVFETGAGDVVRHIIGDIVVVHRFRIVIFRTPVHIGDISDLPVADVERTVRGKRNLLVGNGLECIDPPTLVDLQVKAAASSVE